MAHVSFLPSTPLPPSVLLPAPFPSLSLSLLCLTADHTDRGADKASTPASLHPSLLPSLHPFLPARLRATAARYTAPRQRHHDTTPAAADFTERLPDRRVAVSHNSDRPCPRQLLSSLILEPSFIYSSCTWCEDPKQWLVFVCLVEKWDLWPQGNGVRFVNVFGTHQPITKSWPEFKIYK